MKQKQKGDTKMETLKATERPVLLQIGKQFFRLTKEYEIETPKQLNNILLTHKVILLKEGTELEDCYFGD